MFIITLLTNGRYNNFNYYLFPLLQYINLLVILVMLGETEKYQTRGRPKKNSFQKLPLLSRELFSEHCAVFYASCMVYVLQVFIETKHQKRLGHSEGGFTIYQKVSPKYCFDDVEDKCREWGGEALLKNPQLRDFIMKVNGCSPQLVFRELIVLFCDVLDCLDKNGIDSQEKLNRFQRNILDFQVQKLDLKFKYLRFSSQALGQLKLERWNNLIRSKIPKLWRAFVRINAYTLLCVRKSLPHNKYLKPFFSDADHPQETIIGQLNLVQIVEEEKDHSPATEGVKRTNQLESIEFLKDKIDSNSDKGQNILAVTLISHPTFEQPGIQKAHTTFKKTVEKEKKQRNDFGTSLKFKKQIKELDQSNKAKSPFLSKLQNPLLQKNQQKSPQKKQVTEDILSLDKTKEQVCEDIQKKKIKLE